MPFLTNTQIKYIDVNKEMSIELYKEIIEVKNEEGWIKSWSLSKDVPIWLIGIQDLLKLTY